jgi:uncharacterized heparinase superfamily protein
MASYRRRWNPSWQIQVKIESMLYLRMNSIITWQMKCTVLEIQVEKKIILQGYPTTIENGKYNTKLYVP